MSKEAFVLPWAPFTADIASALKEDIKEIVVEMIAAGRIYLVRCIFPIAHGQGRIALA
jgi:Mg2+/citrate symporter